MMKKSRVTTHDGWVLYILNCRGDRLYTGISNDLKGRLKLTMGLGKLHMG